MKYRLKLKRLDFVSPVDSPAQETAKVLLIKREGEVEGQAASVVKISDELGLVFCWAFTSKSEGADYYDLHGDKIDEDFIAAAAEFMQNGGAVDEMHDGDPDGGRVVFAMPMTPDVAKAYGIECSTVGLMVALKPSPEVLAKFKSGEYTGVSIAGMGERVVEARKAATRVVKHQLATDEVDGHAHAIMIYGDGTVCVMHATAAGSEYAHSHGVVTGDGALTILADAGHTHQIIGAAVVAVPADAIVVVQASESPTKNSAAAPAPAVKSTRSTQTSKVATMQLEEALAEIEGLKASLAESEKRASLSDAEREADLEKSNPIVHKAEDGTVYRKSDDVRLVEMAKRMDEAVKIAKAEAAGRELVELKKRAAEILKGMPGSDDVHVALLKAAEGIADETLRTGAIETLKGARSFVTAAAVAKGVNPGSDPVIENPQAEYDGLVSKAMADHKVDRFKAADMVLATKRGQDLYTAITKRS